MHKANRWIRIDIPSQSKKSDNAAASIDTNGPLISRDFFWVSSGGDHGLITIDGAQLEEIKSEG
jgi:hypothetical protein